MAAILTSISANADGPHDAVSRKIASSTLHASEITRQQVLRAMSKAHCYTKTVSCRLLAHTYTVRPKLHLVDFLVMYYSSKLVVNTQEIELMELEA